MSNYCKCSLKEIKLHGIRSEGGVFICNKCNLVESSSYIPSSTEPNYENENKVEYSLADVVAAQNRTTHAIRAFVRFLFIQLSALTVAYFLNLQANNSVNVQDCANNGSSCSPDTFLQVIAGIVWIVGVVVSSYVGKQELDKSDV